MTNTFPTAEEARAKSNQQALDEAGFFSKLILAGIEKAQKLGKFSTTIIRGRVPDTVALELESLGYKVERMENQKDGHTTTISWE